MSRNYILVDGEPQVADDILEWARWLESADAERDLAKTAVGDVLISTVFLGLDHSWTGGPPVLWETMVFGGEHDSFQERYTSRAAALAGHAAAVKMVRGDGADTPAVAEPLPGPPAGGG